MFSKPLSNDFKFLGKSKVDAKVATIVGDVTGLQQPEPPLLVPRWGYEFACMSEG